MADPTVKPEPGSPGMEALPHEDDVYEDAGDLEFCNRDSTGNPNLNDKMFFVRLPKYLWESWSHLDDDAEIQIGTIRKWEAQEPVAVGYGKNRRTEMKTENRFKMLLHGDRPEHQAIPKEYDLEVTEPAVMNTFLFTEQDLPSYRFKNKVKAEQQKAGIPQNLIRSSWASQSDTHGTDGNNANSNSNSNSRYGDRRGRRYTPYRKAVPKKTTIQGRFRHELNCAPVNNEEARQLLRSRVRDATQPKRTMELMSMMQSAGQNVIHQGTAGAFDKFQNFIKTNEKPVTKQKKQEAKATRVSQGELRDMLNACFKKFTYWSMKALRAETQQPEAYLRENLELIAELHKSGSFANHWSLKEEFRSSSATGANAVAPIASADPDGSEFEGDEEDATTKMEI
ncbi:putative transcription initiation factor iif protein [Zalerion maritima]|uniref:Transcription initiation factor IIF subunit beta n=1 Tax=Zalerion maritima TaxID=339359 RepID=A0AAD5WN02_9PEZI|nr:putative transcription initiation factor iif protein [Zalerion maritima]